MSGRVDRLRGMLSLVRRSKNLIIFGVPALLTALWIMAVSEHFRVGSLALRSGVFVFVVVMVPAAILHTVVLVVIERKLEGAEKAARVPKATLQKE